MCNLSKVDFFEIKSIKIDVFYLIGMFDIAGNFQNQAFVESLILIHAINVKVLQFMPFLTVLALKL